MPARHISSQSFDEILSDLGDDPAIPDPHGIRKPPPNSKTGPKPQYQSKSDLFAEAFNSPQIKNPIYKFGGFIAILGAIIAAAVAFFAAYDVLNKNSQSAFEDSQKSISEIKKEMALLRDEFHQEQDNLYIAIEELEVSIHSLKHIKPETRTTNKTLHLPQESELRRWRYLGMTQMGSLHQAFFNTGKGSAVFEKNSSVLGEWRLNSIEKEAVTLTHSQGKSLVLKASKSEAN